MRMDGQAEEPREGAGTMPGMRVIGESLGHHWIEWRDAKGKLYTCCRDCGSIRRAGGQSKCRGIVRVGPKSWLPGLRMRRKVPQLLRRI